MLEAAHALFEFNRDKFSYYLRSNKLKDRHIAEVCNVDRILVFSWRNGRSNPSVANLCKFSEFLGVPPQEFITNKVKFSHMPSHYVFNRNILKDRAGNCTDLHRGTGLSLRHLRLICNGKYPDIRLDTVLRLAHYYQLDVKDFYIDPNIKDSAA